MKYNGFYCRMFESSMKKVLVEKYGKQYANEIMRKSKKHYNGLFRQKRRHERQLLHLPAGKGKRVPVAALPHAHAPQKRLGGSVKLRRGGVAVFKLIYDGIGEELELGLLHDEHDLRSKLLGRSAPAEERDLPRGGLIKPRDELAERRLAAAAAAAQHDAAPRRNAPGGLLQGRLLRLRVPKCKFKIYHTSHFFLSVS